MCQLQQPVVSASDAPIPKRRPVENCLNVAAIVVGMLLVWRLWRIIDRDAVDVVFLDQWDFYTGVFNGKASLWDLFRWQHGPHRQGLGFLLIRLVDELTGWNQRAQAFTIGAVMVAAAAAALWLKRRLFGRLAWYDLVIPLVILSGLQYELYSNTPNVSHGALPLLLLLCICLAWTIRRPAIRYPLVGLLTFLATHTGFGVFSGLVVPAALVLEAATLLAAKPMDLPAQRERRVQLAWLGVGLALCGVTVYSFFHGYAFIPAAPNFVFPYPNLTAYPQFMSLEFAYLLGAESCGRGETIYGGVVVLAVGIASLYGAWRIVRRGGRDVRLSLAIFLLSAFALAFSANSAVGRVSLGWDAARTSRYLPLLMPGVIAFYLFVLAQPAGRMQRALLAVLLVLAAVASCRKEVARERFLVDIKKAWVANYLQTHSISQASAAAGGSIHPDARRTHLEAKLAYLEARKLSLFRQKP